MPYDAGCGTDAVAPTVTAAEADASGLGVPISPPFDAVLSAMERWVAEYGLGCLEESECMDCMGDAYEETGAVRDEVGVCNEWCEERGKLVDDATGTVVEGRGAGGREEGREGGGGREERREEGGCCDCNALVGDVP